MGGGCVINRPVFSVSASLKVLFGVWAGETSIARGLSFIPNIERSAEYPNTLCQNCLFCKLCRDPKAFLSQNAYFNLPPKIRIGDIPSECCWWLLSEFIPYPKAENVFWSEPLWWVTINVKDYPVFICASFTSQVVKLRQNPAQVIDVGKFIYTEGNL